MIWIVGILAGLSPVIIVYGYYWIKDRIDAKRQLGAFDREVAALFPDLYDENGKWKGSA